MFPREKRGGGPHPDFKDLMGQRIGIVLVEGRVDNDAHGTARWQVVCDCGTRRVMTGIQLRANPPKTHRACRRVAR